MMFDAEGKQETEFNAALQNQLYLGYAGAKLETHIYSFQSVCHYSVISSCGTKVHYYIDKSKQ